MNAARAFAMAGLGLAVIGAVGTVIVRIVAPAPFIGGFGFGPTAMAGYVIAGLTWASIGALLVVRRRDNAVGWLMVVVGVGYALSQLSVSLTFAFAAEGTIEGGRLARIAGWVTVLLQLVTILHFAIAFLFPSGRAQSRGWARFMRLFWAFAIVFVVTSLIQPGPLQLIPALENPFGFGPDLRGDRPIAPILAILTLIIFVSLGFSMVSRYRSADRVVRSQLKWFVLASSLSALGLGIVTWEGTIMNHADNSIGLTAYVFAGALVPLAIGIAILRYHLYDIDRVISRTVGYAVVTGVLAVVFAGVILLVGNLLTALAQGFVPAGRTQSIEVAISTLVVFALFQPVRRRVQRAVDRRFDRARYDADQTVRAFAGRLRNDIDLAAVSQEIVATATTAVRPANATVWLRAARR